MNGIPDALVTFQRSINIASVIGFSGFGKSISTNKYLSDLQIDNYPQGYVNGNSNSVQGLAGQSILMSAYFQTFL